jgi:ornithine cyclodeaminase
MPGYTANPEWLGIKVVSVFPDNFGTERGSHQGMVLLFDAGHGSPVAIVDGREITAIRTSAVSAVATAVLARRDASNLAILGYGEQARAHARCLPLVRRFERMIVWGRDVAKTEKFCAWAAAEIGIQVESAASARAAVDLADVICATTAAAEPIIQGAWLRAGQHLNIVGSSIPSTAEVDVEAVARSRFFVDFKDSALELAGDFRRALNAGAIGEGHIRGSIGDVLVGECVGRACDEDITLFKSLGMVCEDLVAADFVFREGERLKIGTVIDW